MDSVGVARLEKRWGWCASGIAGGRRSPGGSDGGSGCARRTRRVGKMDEQLIAHVNIITGQVIQILDLSHEHPISLGDIDQRLPR